MFNWLKRLVSGYELAKLERMEIAFANAASWFSEHKDITEVLFHVRDVGLGSQELSHIDEVYRDVMQLRNNMDKASISIGRIKQRAAEAKIDEEMGVLTLLSKQDLAELVYIGNTGSISNAAAYKRLVDAGVLRTTHGITYLTHFGTFIVTNTNKEINDKKAEAVNA